MNSSTSSFKTELKVFAVVFLLLGAYETYERLNFGHHPDAASLLQYPALAGNLAAQPGTRILLLGNSLTVNGYDLPLLRQSLSPNLHVDSIAVPGANHIEWFYNLDRNFLRPGKAPDVIVINLSPNGLSDELLAGYRVGWLAHETGWDDAPTVVTQYLNNFEVSAQYLQARVLMTSANRWDIRNALMQRLVPNIWDGMKWVNNHQPAPKTSAPRAPDTYRLLNTLLDTARAHKVRAIVVAMPARDPYALEPELPAILQSHNTTLLDCRSIPNLPTEGFEDHWHLNPQGAKIFTTHIAQRLQQTLSPPSTR